MDLRKAIRRLVLEQSCLYDNMEATKPISHTSYSIEIDKNIVKPVMDALLGTNSQYSDNHHTDAGRMMDYGHVKSDSREGRMTRAKLFRMGKMAQSFHDRLDDNDDLPQWVNDKVTTAEDRLKSAFEYIDYKIHRMKKDGINLSEGQVRRIIRGSLKQIL